MTDTRELVVGPKMTDNATFGHILLCLRERVGLSRSAAASEFGTSSEYLRLIETGKRSPALGQMHRLLDIYQTESAIEKIQPDGIRKDLVIVDPNTNQPVTVTFVSRIRNARYANDVEGAR